MGFMKNFEWLNALIWTVVIAYYFLDLSSLLTVSDNKDNKVIVNVDKKPEKIKEDKDTIKTDW